MGEDRKHNPFLNSPTGGRVLSALQLPLFALRPPPGYAILTTTGRKTGKTRRRCVRAVRRGDKVFVVAIKGRTAWLRNIEATPEVRLRLRGGRFDGTARALADDAERQEALDAYCEPFGVFERLEYRMWRTDKPTPEKIEDLHRHWFETGAPLVIELG